MENRNTNYTVKDKDKARGAAWLLGGIVAVIVVLTIAYVRSDYDRNDLSGISPAAGEASYIPSSTPSPAYDGSVNGYDASPESRGLTDMPPQPEPQP